MGRVLERREAWIALKRQAALSRAVHHSDRLEVELARRNIPFVKYGGIELLVPARLLRRHGRKVNSRYQPICGPDPESAASRINRAPQKMGPPLRLPPGRVPRARSVSPGAWIGGPGLRRRWRRWPPGPLLSISLMVSWDFMLITVTENQVTVRISVDLGIHVEKVFVAGHDQLRVEFGIPVRAAEAAGNS